MRIGEPAAGDDMSQGAGNAVLTCGERLTVMLLWLTLAWLPSLTLWVLTGYFGRFYSPLLWLVVAGASAPAMGRVLGQVDAFEALPPAPRSLSHLPAALARMVEEAAAIRGELAAHGLEPALERAWILVCEFERLPPDLGVELERSRAALAPVRELLDARARPGRSSPTQQHARLDVALAQFEAALAEPAQVGFR